MARKKSSKSQQIRCTHFTWMLTLRAGVYQADGRSNQPPAGRHSLNTRNYEKAFENLNRLDESMAIALGLKPANKRSDKTLEALPLKAGRDAYLQHVGRSRALKGATASTLKRYGPVFDKALTFFKKRGHQNWNEISKSEIEAYGDFLVREEYAHATQVLEVVTLKQAINYFIEGKLLPPEHDFKLEVDKVDDSMTYCFTPNEVTAMIDYCGQHKEFRWLADVIVGLAYTGMRISELAQLRWSAVDLVRKDITVVDESRNKTKSGTKARTTKSGKSRQIPILSKLLAVLQRIHSVHSTGLVFRAQRGGPLRPRNVLKALVDNAIEPLKDRFPRNGNDASFEDGRLHSLRHFFCSLCANRQVSERVLQKWLGHSSSAMIKRYYHLHDEESHRQMDKLEFGDGPGLS
jgi:integrase